MVRIDNLNLDTEGYIGRVVVIDTKERMIKVDHLSEDRWYHEDDLIKVERGDNNE